MLVSDYEIVMAADGKMLFDMFCKSVENAANPQPIMN